MDRSSLPVINGIPTYIQREGNGPPLVMLHGMADTSDCWQYTVEAFRADYQVIAPDLPGHGRSEGKAKPYNLRFYVDWLADLLDQYSATKPVALIGNSMGGAISLSYTLERPDRVSSLALVDPLGLNASPPWSALGHSLLSLPNFLIAALTKKADPYLMRAIRPWVFRDPWGSPYEAIIRASALNLEQGFWAVGAGLRVVFSDFFSPRQRQNFLDRLGELTLPTLVVWGSHDGVLPYHRAAAGLSKLPQARVEIFEESSHSAMLEQPDEFNALVRQFLNGKTTKRKAKLPAGR